jgi:nucleoid-associated protein YgaU
MSKSRRQLLARMIEAQKRQKTVVTLLPLWLFPDGTIPDDFRAQWPAEFIAEQEAYLEQVRQQAAQAPKPPADPAAARARIEEIDRLLASVKTSPVMAALPPLVTWARCVACGQPAEQSAGSEDTPRCSLCRRGGS